MFRHLYLFIILVFCVALAVSAFAGFDYKDEIGFEVTPPSSQYYPPPYTDWYNMLAKACDDLEAVNEEAGKGIREMLNSGKINLGYGPETGHGGGWTIADGQQGTSGDAINLNPEYVSGGMIETGPDTSRERHHPDMPSTWNGSCWNQLLGVLAHEWVHANSSQQPPTSEAPPAIQDYTWEKPAFEKEMEVLEALGEPTGFYNAGTPQDPKPEKTRHQFLLQELEKKRKKAEEQLRKWLKDHFRTIAAAAAAGWKTFDFSFDLGSPLFSRITWGVDGNILWGMDPDCVVGDRMTLPFDDELSFYPVDGLPAGTDHAVLFATGTAGNTGVIVGLEISGAEIIGMPLHLEIPDCEPRSIAYRATDSTLWILDGTGKQILVLEDPDGNGIPEFPAAEPFAAAADFPVIDGAQELVVGHELTGIGVAPKGAAPFDMLPVQEPFTLLQDADGDGLADIALASGYGELTTFAPKLLDQPVAGQLACRIFGVAGAEVTLLTTDEFGVPLGEELGLAVVGPDNLAVMPLIRPLIEGEYICLFDPVYDLHHEAHQALVLPAGTNHPPVPVCTGWQIVAQTNPAGAMVSFDASASFDPDGDALFFEWEELLDSYSNCPLLGTGPAITVPMSPGIHVVRLTVSDDQEKLYTYTSVGIVPSIPVQIDIKPGAADNAVNLDSNGLIPVAILTTPDFDAGQVNPATVTLAGATVGVKGKSDRLMTSMEDVDGDGDLDLSLKIENQLIMQEGSTEAALFGTCYNGDTIGGSDIIKIVPPDK